MCSGVGAGRRLLSLDRGAPGVEANSVALSIGVPNKSGLPDILMPPGVIPITARAAGMPHVGLVSMEDSAAPIRVLATKWCGDCRAARRVLASKFQ